MPQIKYIAEGFLEDATDLLEDFSQKSCLEFSVFTEIWRERKFSFIYAKRENVKELGEFTQEIFKITGRFLSANSLAYQVGCVFLLYALYRNQVINPKIPIRITQFQFQDMKALLAKAEKEDLRSLHYTLDYLFENSLELVASPTLMGPSVRLVAKRFLNTEDQLEMRSELRSNLAEIKDNDMLKHLRQIFTKYAALRGGDRKWTASIDKCNKFSGELDRLLGDCNSIFDESVLEKPPPNSAIASSSNFTGIGSRRSKLKAAAFNQTIYPYLDCDFDQTADAEGLTSIEDKKKPFLSERERRVVKYKRNSRRKKKAENCEDSDDSFTKLIKKKLPKRSKAKHNEKAPRIRHYFKQSPTSKGKSEECLSSDVDGELYYDHLKSISKCNEGDNAARENDLLEELSDIETVDLRF